MDPVTLSFSTGKRLLYWTRRKFRFVFWYNNQSAHTCKIGSECDTLTTGHINTGASTARMYPTVQYWTNVIKRSCVGMRHGSSRRSGVEYDFYHIITFKQSGRRKKMKFGRKKIKNRYRICFPPNEKFEIFSSLAKDGNREPLVQQPHSFSGTTNHNTNDSGVVRVKCARRWN